MQVQFKLKYAQTKMGQNLQIIGGTQSLGAWK
jgi:hypothetical protein